MTRRLGAWDCSYCSTKRILGNVFDCPGCGHPRPRGVRFYQIPDGPIVTPEIAKQLGSGGPNWYCEHCDSGNKDNNDKCWNCGAERGSSPSHRVKNYLQGEHVPQSTEEAEKSAQNKQSWISSLPAEGIKLSPNYEGTKVQETSAIGAGNLSDKIRNLIPKNVDVEPLKPYAKWTAISAGAILVIFLIYQLFFNTHEELVHINNFYWDQKVVVQEYMVMHESSWSSHPSDAYNVSSAYMDTGRDEKVHDGWVTVEYMGTCSESVYVSDTCSGTTDNGDGSFDTYSYECGSYETRTYSCTQTRQEELYHYEDVYDWLYTYDINRWGDIATYPTTGNDHRPYYYNEFVLENPYGGVDTPNLGQQQYLLFPGRYTITFLCPENTKVGESGYFTREYTLEEWEKFDSYATYTIEVNAFNGIRTNPSP